METILYVLAIIIAFFVGKKYPRRNILTPNQYFIHRKQYHLIEIYEKSSITKDNKILVFQKVTSKNPMGNCNNKNSLSYILWTTKGYELLFNNSCEIGQIYTVKISTNIVPNTKVIILNLPQPF